MKQEFTLNGNKISNKHTFFKEISQTIFPDYEWKYGYSYDILDDLLSGGYSFVDYNESYVIRWQNFKRSAKKMEGKVLFYIVGTFDELENVVLILE